MNKNYIVSEKALGNAYFRIPVKIAVSLLLLGTAVTLTQAQQGRVVENLSNLAKLSYDPQINLAAAKITTSPNVKSTSKSIVALGGTYTVGTGGDYTTLTAAVADFNSAPITGSVTFSLLDASYEAETFPILISENAGSSAINTLTIKPAAGVNATISSNAPTIFKFAASDYVTIDGSNNGTTTQNLTLSSTATTGTNVIAWVASTAAAGADYVTFKNIKFVGQTPSATIGHILVSGPVLGGVGTVANNHLTVEGNDFKKGQNGVYLIGPSGTIQDDGAIIKNNTIGSSTDVVNQGMGFRGIGLQNAKNVLISGNKIGGVKIAGSNTSQGIILAGVLNNTIVTANQINDVSNTNTTGYGAAGILSAVTVGSGNLLISNNFVSNVYARGYDDGTVSDNGNGIVVGGTATGVKIYNNTVTLNTNQTTTGRPAAINILAEVVAGALDIRNNIFVNNQTQIGEKYAIYYGGTNNSVFANLNYNNYSTTGANLGFFTSNKVDLAAIKTAFGGNANSLNIAPTFVSTTDLHLTPANQALDNKGTALADVTVDIDGQTRSATKPDMGADEFKASLNGTYTVGSTGDYASLTNTGGVFEDINAGLVGGNLTFNIIEDLTAETGTNPLNAIAGGYTVTIKPDGAARIISGTTNNNALIRTVGASNVTIDGSLSNGTDKSLSITNLSTNAPQVVKFGSLGAAPMINNTLKNTIITNGANTSTAVVVADNAGTAGTFNNINIKNNTIKKAYIGVYALATISAGNGHVTMSDNDLSATGTDAIALAGLYAQGTDGAVIQNNTIGNFNPTSALARRGIFLASGTVNSKVAGNTISNITAGAAAGNGAVGIFVASGNTGSLVNTNNVIEANSISGLASASTSIVAGIHLFGATGAGTSGVTISKNKITNIRNSNSGGYAAVGIYFNGYSSAANGGVNVFNNFISDVANYGYNGTGYLDNGVGITFNGASTGYKIYNNTINMNSEQTITTGMTAAINVPSTITGVGAIDLRNNIFVNSQTTTVNRYAIYSAAPATVYSNIDYNDYYSSGTNLGYLGSARATLANWQAATGKDANSLNISPAFVSATDLHLSSVNVTLDNKGTPLAEVTMDIDDEARSTTTPDIGADEFTGSLAAQNVSKNSVKLYPNPVVDFVNINYSSKIDSVEVYNVAGQKVATQNWNAASGTMDMRNLAPGMYIIKLKLGNEVQSVKVIKK